MERHDAREELYAVAFAAGCGQAALSRPPAVQLLLDESHIEYYARRTAIYDTANGSAMTLAKSGQTK